MPTDIIRGDQNFQGAVVMSNATSVTYKPNTIADAAVSSSAAIAATKLQHRHKIGTNFDLAIGATPVAREEVVFVASAACTINGFHALLNDTGTTTDVDFDLKINGTTALSSVVTIVHGDADRLVKDGTLSTTTLAADDVVSIQLLTTSTTGAQGPFAWVEIDEAAA